LFLGGPAAEGFAGAEWLTLRAQRALSGPPSPRVHRRRHRQRSANGTTFPGDNGTTLPDDESYEKMASDFANWRLESALVERPLSLSLAELRQLPARTQITRHDCVEGWSCIGKWKGPMLSTILDRVALAGAASSCSTAPTSLASLLTRITRAST
jgi:DMSO/TMAO reductase YedYZ molybdopterin-dependent catalytic subunit